MKFSFKGGSIRVFRFDENDARINTSKRTHASYLDDVKKAEETGTPSRGVKGRCCLQLLKSYEPTRSTCPDYMHSILEGVMKSFFKYWFEGDSARRFSLRKYMQEIDNRILSIKPPSFIFTAPRSIYVWQQWRAHEFLSFLIYYVIPVFYKIIPYDLYNNIIKLVIFVEILLSPTIKRNELNAAHNIIKEFLKELSELYDSLIMLSGVHELQHLVDCTKEFGPLNLINCFPFEELNRKFMRFIHGKDLIGEEFIKVFSTAQTLTAMTSMQRNKTEIFEFIQENLDFQTSNRKKLHASDNSFKFLSASTSSLEPSILRAYFSYFKETVSEVTVFTKLKYKGHFYNAGDNSQGKHDDSCFLTKSGQLGIIKFMFEKEGVVYAIGKKIVTSFNPFFCAQYPQRKSMVSICRKSEEIFIEQIDSIEKMVFIQFNDGCDCFISTFKSSHLFM